MAARRTVKKMVKVDNSHKGGASGTPTNEAVDSALKNLVIVSEIGRYLDFEELKRCRLINKVWDELVLIIMRKRAVLRFDPPTSSHFQTFLPSLKQWNVDFKSQVKFMEEFNMGNIKLNLCQSRAVQVKNDMFWLLDNFLDQIKYVAIKIDVSNRTDWVLLSKILQHRLDSLKGVELDVNIVKDCKMIELPYLETVDILKIRGTYRLGNVFLPTPAYFPYSNPLNETTLLQFPNLKTLEVYDVFFRDQFAVDFLQKLKTLPQFGFENLGFTYLGVNQPGFNALSGALEMHAPTLQSLRLGWISYGYYGNIDFVSPHFPKLKKLELTIEGVQRYLQANDIINWRFPGGQVFYKDDFPLLEDLKVELRTLTKFHVKKVLEAFFPLGTPPNTCHTMKRVHFDIEMNWEDQDDKIWIREFWKRFENTFPNAILTPEYLVKVKDAFKMA